MRWVLIGMSSLMIALGAPSLAIGQQPLNRVSVDDAVQLALKQNPTLLSQQATLLSTKAGETTAALRPNPTMNFAAEQLRPGGSQSEAQNTVSHGQPIEL